MTPGVDSYTKLMLHFNEADGSTHFHDSATDKTVTVSGNAQIDTAQKKFGSASGLFDGSGDYITFPDSADWAFGSGDFTIDFWVQFNDTPTSGNGRALFIQRQDDNNCHYLTLYNDTGTLKLYHVVFSGGAVVIDNHPAWTPTTGVWYHIAACRYGNSFKLYVNGTMLTGGEVTSSASLPDLTGTFKIGDHNSNWQFNGWIDEFRVSKGVARWTENFTPPTEAYDTECEIAESLSADDAETVDANEFVRTIAESFSGDDSEDADSPYRDIAESLSVDDGHSVEWTVELPLAESLSVDDGIVGGMEMLVSLAESLSGDDAVSQIQEFTDSLPESLSVDDAPGVVVEYAPALAESVSADDAEPVAWDVQGDIEESASLDDGQVIGREILGSLDESLSGDDVIDGHLEFDDSIAESLAVNAFVESNVYLESANSAFAVDDAASVVKEIFSAIAESHSVNDSVVGEAFTGGRIAESLPALRAELLGNNVIATEIPTIGISSFSGTVGKVGTLRQGTLPAITMAAIGYVEQRVTLLARLPAFSSSVSGTQHVTETLSLTLPAISSTIVGKVGPVCTLDGQLPILEKGVITGYINPRGTISASLPALESNVFVDSLVFEVLCMNTANMGLTTYTNFPFNSMCRFKDRYLGCSAAGIYEISSAYGDDDGTVIRPQVRTGFIDLEKNIMKRIDHAWLGFQANGALSVSIVTDDGNTYTYTVDQLTTNDTGQRVKFGKGIKDRYVAIDIQAACSVFELDKIRIFARPTAKGR